MCENNSNITDKLSSLLARRKKLIDMKRAIQRYLYIYLQFYDDNNFYVLLCNDLVYYLENK